MGQDWGFWDSGPLPSPALPSALGCSRSPQPESVCPGTQTSTTLALLARPPLSHTDTNQPLPGVPAVPQHPAGPLLLAPARGWAMAAVAARSTAPLETQPRPLQSSTGGQARPGGAHPHPQPPPLTTSSPGHGESTVGTKGLSPLYCKKQKRGDTVGPDTIQSSPGRNRSPASDGRTKLPGGQRGSPAPCASQVQAAEG